MEDPIKVWELSKNKTGLPVELCVIDINEDYQDDDYQDQNYQDQKYQNSIYHTGFL